MFSQPSFRSRALLSGVSMPWSHVCVSLFSLSRKQNQSTLYFAGRASVVLRRLRTICEEREPRQRLNRLTRNLATSRTASPGHILSMTELNMHRRASQPAIAINSIYARKAVRSRRSYFESEAQNKIERRENRVGTASAFSSGFFLAPKSDRIPASMCSTASRRALLRRTC